MVLIHGFSDHVNRYYGFFPYLAERGIAVYGFDQRGWGRSVKQPGDKGKTGPTSRVLADMAAFIEDKLKLSSNDGSDSDSDGNVPLFVLGHSMGGGQALALASSPESTPEAAVAARVRGWILEAPFLGFAPALKPHWLTVMGGRLASHVVPNYQMVYDIPPELVSRDPEVQRDVAADALCHNTGTLGGLASMLDRTNQLASGAMKLSPKVVRSLLLCHGTGDQDTSIEKSREWFDRETPGVVRDATFVAYPDMYHQLHADYGKEAFYRDVADWILERTETKGGAPAPAPAPAPEAKL